MDPEQLDEFYGLRETAHEGLRSGSFCGREWGRPVCRFVALPSIENAVAWDVVPLPAKNRPAGPRLFRSCWRMDTDLQALGSPVERLRHPRPYPPTIEVESVPIDAGRVAAVLRRLRETRIPLALDEAPCGVDGTTYELWVGESFWSTQIRWWVRLPEGWQPIGPVIAEMVDLFESSWQDASAHGADENATGA